MRCALNAAGYLADFEMQSHREQTILVIGYRVCGSWGLEKNPHPRALVKIVEGSFLMKNSF